MSSRIERAAKLLQGAGNVDDDGVRYTPFPEWSINKNRPTYYSKLVEGEDYWSARLTPEACARFDKADDTFHSVEELTKVIMAWRQEDLQQDVRNLREKVNTTDPSPTAPPTRRAKGDSK